MDLLAPNLVLQSRAAARSLPLDPAPIPKPLLRLQGSVDFLALNFYTGIYVRDPKTMPGASLTSWTGSFLGSFLSPCNPVVRAQWGGTVPGVLLVALHPRGNRSRGG